MLQDGEASRLYQRQHSKEQQPLMQEQETLEPDLLPCDLADSDSVFNAVGAVEVHHKISYPEVSISLEWKTAACHNIKNGFCHQAQAFLTQDECATIVTIQEVRFPGCGIVLLHPFEGGVFSFRLIMNLLAEDVGCPVLSFDRPGAGLVRSCT